METYNAKGELEADFVLFQLKATDHLKRTADGTAVVLRVERVDLDSWFGQTFPVVLVVYDTRAEVAYWLYLQARYPRGRGLPKTAGATVTVHIPTANVLNEDAIRRFAAAKAAIQQQTREVRHHV